MTVAAAAGEMRELIAGDPVPFAGVLAPLVVSASADIVLERFAPQARTALQRALLRRLARAAAPALYAEFDRGRPAGSALFARFFGPPAEPSRERYDTFEAALRDGGFRAFLQRHPLLEPLLDTIVAGWRGAAAELAQRLEDDLVAIRARFRWDSDPGAIVRVEPDLSDLHHGGRSVAVLHFVSGARLVYKPRSLAADAAFGELLAWCDAGLRAPALLDRGTHGWAEHIDHLPCADAEAVDAFYRNAGKLLCVLRLCGATDGHFENLVAHGDQLVLIDAETVLQPHVPQPSAPPEDDERARDSVVRTGLLPQWDFSADGRLALDTSALGSFAALQASQLKPAWRNAGTDAMELGTEPWAPLAPRSVPLLNGEPVEPRAHAGAFVDGFAEMHRSIAARRDELIAAAESRVAPLAALAAPRVRFIPRATQDYMLVLDELLRPASLKSESARERAFDALSSAFSQPSATRALAAIVPAERRALERMDVPHFTVAATGDELDPGDGERVAVPGLTQGFADLVARLRRWDDDDLRYQTAVVRGMVQARTARAFAVTSDAKPTPPPADAATAAVRHASFVAAACALGDELAAAGIPARDGTVSWLGLAHHAGADRFALEPLGFDLYGGTAGIALFFAALAAVAGEPRFRAHALGALERLRRRLRSPDDARDLAGRLGIGGASGMGSIVYALVKIAALLDDPALLDDARAAALSIGDEQIARDEIYDPVAGSAGTILGVAALQRAAPDARVLAVAVAAGEHLLHARSETPGRRAWTTFAPRPLTGMAHGAAGIALALVRLHALTADRRFLDAAREAIAYERSVYAHDAGNWPDFRDLAARDGVPGHSVMWCHGAPGIGLARLAMPRDDDDVVAEIDAAVAATVAFGLRGPDYLCCGNFGRAELLLQAGVVLARPDFRLRAEALAETLLDDARREGGFRLVYDARASEFKPDLFRGASGIGYALLRIAAPERVPSVLSWE